MIKLQNMIIGKEYRYRELCSLLEEEPTTSNGKAAQLKRWKTMFRWEHVLKPDGKISKGFTIRHIYDTPLPFHNNHGGYRVNSGVKSNITQHLRLMCDLIASSNSPIRCFTRRELIVLSGFCSTDKLYLEHLSLNKKKVDTIEEEKYEDMRLLNSRLIHDKFSQSLSGIVRAKYNTHTSKCFILYYNDDYSSRRATTEEETKLISTTISSIVSSINREFYTNEEVYEMFKKRYGSIVSHSSFTPDVGEWELYGNDSLSRLYKTLLKNKIEEVYSSNNINLVRGLYFTKKKDEDKFNREIYITSSSLFISSLKSKVADKIGIKEFNEHYSPMWRKLKEGTVLEIDRLYNNNTIVKTKIKAVPIKTLT